MSETEEIEALNLERFQNFIIFEPASQRVKDIDILMRGEEIYEIFLKVEASLEEENSLELQIMKNRLSKIRKMLDLVIDFENIVMTKFFDRIWKRYSYLSNLGETFLDITTFLKVLPAYQDYPVPIIATRLDEENEEDEEDPVVEPTF